MRLIEWDELYCLLAIARFSYNMKVIITSEHTA